VKVESPGINERLYTSYRGEGGQNIVLLEGSQVLPVRPSDKSRLNVKTFGWLEAVAWNRGRKNLIEVIFMRIAHDLSCHRADRWGNCERSNWWVITIYVTCLWSFVKKANKQSSLDFLLSAFKWPDFAAGLLRLSLHDDLMMETEIASEASDIKSISIRLIAGEKFTVTWNCEPFKISMFLLCE
jgi:hypothetical protein